MKNPFRNYKQALNFLFQDLNKKSILSNYEISMNEWAVYTLYKSKDVHKLLNKKKNEK